MIKKYDSAEDTRAHINRVRELVGNCIRNLQDRRLVHDQSKLTSMEKAIFDEMTPKLKDSTYGSDEYKGFLAAMKPALDHHYANNSHHPEHYPNGIDGMSLLDLIEMLCDWKAAGERHANGSMERSLEVNRARFNVSPQLQSALENTARELGWLNSQINELGSFITPSAVDQH